MYPKITYCIFIELNGSLKANYEIKKELVYFNKLEKLEHFCNLGYKSKILLLYSVVHFIRLMNIN